MAVLELRLTSHPPCLQAYIALPTYVSRLWGFLALLSACSRLLAASAALPAPHVGKPSWWSTRDIRRCQIRKRNFLPAMRPDQPPASFLDHCLPSKADQHHPSLQVRLSVWEARWSRWEPLPSVSVKWRQLMVIWFGVKPDYQGPVSTELVPVYRSTFWWFAVICLKPEVLKINIQMRP